MCSGYYTGLPWLKKRKTGKGSSGMGEIDQEVFVHESSYVDGDVKIGKGSKVWHFSHILSDSEIGENCSLGQK